MNTADCCAGDGAAVLSYIQTASIIYYTGGALWNF